MDFTRIQAQLDYRLTEPWGVTLRLPYDIKDRSASVELVDPATALEQEQMQDFLDLHHPDAVLTGFGDASLLATWHAHDFAKEGAHAGSQNCHPPTLPAREVQASLRNAGLSEAR